MQCQTTPVIFDEDSHSYQLDGKRVLWHHGTYTLQSSDWVYIPDDK